MPNTFDEASMATEEMFANAQETPAGGEAITEETPPATGEQAETENARSNGAEMQTGEQTVLAEAARTAEVAAETAAEKDGLLRQALADNEALRQQNQQLQGTIDEISRQNEEEALEEALAPPTLDINGLAFADEAAQRAAMAKYAEELTAFNKKQLMQELSPVLDYAKRGMREAEKTEVLEALSHVPELSGLRDMLPQLDRIIQNNKWLSSDDMPLDEKYINAYAMARGVNAINNPPKEPEKPKEPTTEELFALYNQNPALQELIEKQRLQAVKESQQVPPFSASSGAVNAALNIKEKPKTFEEASERTRKMFGAD